MKFFNTITLMVAIVMGMSLMISCNKDEDMLLPEDLIGVWDVKKGEALVFDNADINDSYKIETEGTITFNADGTGADNLTLTFKDNTDRLTESYTWELASNQLSISTQDGTSVWQVEQSKKGLDIIQRAEMPDHEGLEIEVTLFLRK